MILFRKYKEYRLKKNIQKRFPTSNVDLKVGYDNSTTLEGMNVVGSQVSIHGSVIGYCTVIGTKTSLPNCKIGKFCSIASNVRVVPATHPTNFVSTYPSFFKTINNYPFGKGERSFQEFIKTKNGFFCEIGNDVWVGENVLIKGGISIGDGAIIGMGAVVTKDVPPYTIVGGVPAKLIRFRMDENQIAAILGIQWWNWNIDDIKKRRNDFLDINTFIQKYKN